MSKKVLFVFQKFQAFPCISTGFYGYPPQNAAVVALKAVRQFLAKHHNEVDRVIFCLFLDNDVDIYEKLLQMYFPVSKTSGRARGGARERARRKCGLGRPEVGRDELRETGRGRPEVGREELHEPGPRRGAKRGRASVC
jgi:hypothetical protein